MLYNNTDVDQEKVNKDGYESYLEQLKVFITNRDIFGAGVISTITTTRYAVQFKYNGYIDVDLLVSPVWWRGNPKQPNGLFSFLRDRVQDNAEARHK